MKEIRKIRVLPRGYVRLNTRQVIEQPTKGAMWDLFLRYGRPESDNSFMLKYKDIVFRFVTEDKPRMDIFLSPKHRLVCERQRVKAINVLAHRMNDADIVFPYDEHLYYANRHRNALLRVKYETIYGENSEEAIQRVFSDALQGDFSQYAWVLSDDDLAYNPELSRTITDFLSLYRHE